MKDTLHNPWPVLLKTVKIMKNKESQKMPQTGGASMGTGSDTGTERGHRWNAAESQAQSEVPPTVMN